LEDINQLYSVKHISQETIFIGLAKELGFKQEVEDRRKRGEKIEEIMMELAPKFRKIILEEMRVQTKPKLLEDVNDILSSLTVDGNILEYHQGDTTKQDIKGENPPSTDTFIDELKKGEIPKYKDGDKPEYERLRQDALMDFFSQCRGFLRILLLPFPEHC